MIIGLKYLHLFLVQYLMSLALAISLTLILWWQLPTLCRLISGGRGATG